MKRIIEFKYQNNSYQLLENGICIFSISALDLKFNSISFYNGVYKDKGTNIELVNKIESDPNKKGTYIFSWLSEIVSSINKEFKEEDDDVEEPIPTRIIPLFEFSACAGDGFYIEGNIPHEDIKDQTGKADYAVKVSGDSMEPTLKDKSVIFIKRADKPEQNDVGLFIVNGEVMCKRYMKQGRGYRLVPDNAAYNSISSKDVNSFVFLGKVII